MDVSVIIPGRNEEFFSRTVEQIVGAIRGDSEVIAVIDGEHAGPEIKAHPRVRVIRNETPKGQRQSINIGAWAARGKYILKTDAHSMLDEGFDVKLMAECEYDWIVIPRMYNLHAFDLVCKCGLRLNNHRQLDRCPQCNGAGGDMHTDIVWQPKSDKKTDWMYFRSPWDADKPLRVQYYGNWDYVCTACGYRHDRRGDHETCRKCGHGEFRKERAFGAEYKAHKQWARKQGDLADVMTGQGACWFMRQDRFYELGMLDEGHGSWGQMGVEIACKAWLSGGRHVVNRKTWFAHFFRCGNGPHFPYSISGKSQDKARQYSVDLWTSGTWKNQVRPLEWIADKFAPVPTWDNNKVRAALPGKTTPQKKPKAQASPAKSDTPLLSVIIPARNEKYLHQTVADLQKNLRTDYEIIIGIDGMPQDPAYDVVKYALDERVRVAVSDERIGMRPTINKLAREARGRYLMKLDAHVAVDEGVDEKLIAAWKPCGAVVPHRYDLDTQTWQRRKPSRTDCRRLTHESEDGVGLRAMDWPEYSERTKDKSVVETMACSGSCWLMERELFVDLFEGWDENHGTFGQEGCELACKVWLSGGRLLLVKDTWYAHWNRGKSTYSLGASEKPRSISYSHDLWLNNKWPKQKYSFDWLLDRFHPPGWTAAVDPEHFEDPSHFKIIPMGGPCKPWNRGVTVADLWTKRRGISEPSKLYRLDIFWLAFEEFVQSVLDGNPDFDGRYKQYLISHLKRTGLRKPARSELRHVQKKMDSAVKLIHSIRENGFYAPLEFYRSADGKMILWKGYRRLAIAHVLGVKKVPLRAFYDRRTAGIKSPQNNMINLTYPPSDRLKKIAEKQFNRYGLKSTDKYFVHGYTEYYDRYFCEMRKRCRKLLELGVARGASLALWHDYFPGAEIVGGDIDHERWKQFAGRLERVTFIGGDEEDPAYLSRLASAGPYDIIIDDADHHPQKQRRVFDALWPRVRDHGYYVIEDNYRTFADNDQGRCLDHGMEDRIISGARDIAEIHWHLNIVFIRKAPQ